MKNGERQRFFVSGICCATEETLLRKKLDGIAGSDAYQFRVLTGELILDRDVPADVVRSEIRKAGFGIRTSRDIREPLRDEAARFASPSPDKRVLSHL